MSIGFISVPVIPTFKGMSKEFSERLEKPAKAAGERAGKSISDGVDAGVKNLEKQVQASQKKLDDLDRAYERSFLKQEQKKSALKAATLDLAAAEEKYQRAVDAGKSGTAELAKVERAKGAVTKATNDLRDAEIEVRAAEKKHENQLDDLNRTLEKLQRTQREHADEVVKSGSKLRRFGEYLREMRSEADKTESTFDRFGRSGVGIGAVAGVFASVTSSVTSSLGGLASEALSASDATDKFKQTLSFAGMDTSAIDAATKSAQAYADATVYELADIQSMTAQLAANGVKDYTALAEAAGNLNAVAGGNAETYKSVGMALSQTAGAGKLTTENWNQLANAIPGASGKLQEAMLKAGAYTGNFRDAMAEGQITAEEFNAAIMQLGSEPVAAEAATSTATFEGMLGNLQATISGDLSKAFTELKPLIGDVFNWTSDFAGKALPVMVDWIGKGAEKLRQMGEWVQRNEEWLKPLAIAVGGIAASFAIWHTSMTIFNAVMGVYNTVVAIAKGETLLFNAALKTNVIVLVVSALAALAAGLVYFFTKTETGKRIWASFMEDLNAAWTWLKDTFTPIFSWIGDAATKAWDGIKRGWDILAGAFMTAWNEWIKPVFDGLVMAGEWVAIGLVTLLIAPLMLQWEAMSNLFKAGWENIIRPAFDALVAFATETLWPVLQQVIQWVGDKWQWLSDAFSIGWSWLRDNVLVPLAAFFSETLWPAVESVLGWVVDKWNWLKDIGYQVATWYFDNVIMTYINGFQWIWDKVTLVADWISDKWGWLTGKLHEGWQWVDQNVLNPFRAGLDTLQGWFRMAVDGITSIWEELKRRIAAPINWVIDVAYNNGIRDVWDKVANLLGMGDKVLPPIPALAFATGGIMPGPATPGRDIHRFFSPTGGILDLSGRESVMRPEWTEVMGEDYVNAMNAAARRGGVAGVRKLMQDAAMHYADGGIIPHMRFADGGVVGSIVGLINRFFPGMTITSTLRNTADLHGQGKAVDASDGFDTTPGMQQMARFFYENYGSGLAELIHWPLNGWQNVDEGRPYDFGEPTNSQHRNHVHIASHAALPAPEDAEGWLAKIGETIKGGIGSAFNYARSKVADLVASILKPIGENIPDFGKGWFGDLGRGAFDKIVGDFIGFIEGKAGAASGAGSFDGAGGVSGNVESWREMAMEAMRRNGFNADDPAQVNAMLAQIQSESGGNPGIAQQIVDVNGTGDAAGVGLLQIIPGTFAAHRDPSLPDDRRDPWANMNAALRYYKSRYGMDLTTMWGHGHGYADGGIISIAKLLGAKLYDVGGILPSGGLAMNQSGEDEFILKNSGMRSLGDLARAVGDLVPALREQAEATAKWLENVADPASEQGIVARALASELGGLFSSFGVEEPGVVIGALLGAEKELLDARSAHAERLADVEEKSRALEEAQKALAEAQSASIEMSVQDKRKLEDAQKALEEAKEPNKKGEVDADKVAKAEEKLKRVREDIAANGAKSEEKRAEDVKKATEQVAEAEAELGAARAKSVQMLDMSIHSLVPQISELASAGAAAAGNAGLGGLAGVLGNVAAMFGPAGMSVGLLIQNVKSIFGVVKAVIGTIKGWIEKRRKSRVDALKTWAQGLQALAQYSRLVWDMQANVAGLQQQLVRGLNEQRTAEFALRVAVNDRLIAEAEGAVAVAKARLDLDKEIENGALAAQLKLMGLHEDWDSYLSLQALAAEGVLEKWSDTAISALFRYEAERAKALKTELQARVDQIKAEAVLAAAVRQNARTQADLVKAQERLIMMSAKVAGVDLEEATATSQIASLVVEIAEAKNAADGNTLGKLSNFLGIRSSRGEEQRGQRELEYALKETLQKVIAETGVQVDMGKLDDTIGLMAKAVRRDGDPVAVLRANMPELLEAEQALKLKEKLDPVLEARDQVASLERQLEDFRSEIDLFEQVTPLEKTIKGLDYSAQSLDHAAEAWASGNEELRGELLAASKANADAAASLGVSWKLDDAYATPQVRDQIAKEVTIHLNGEAMYTADQVDKLLAEVTSGSNVSVVTKRSASTVADSRRKEMV